MDDTPEPATSPSAWNATFSGPPIFSPASRLLEGGSLGRWRGTAERMEQPALDHHLLVVHLGGGKRVRRSGEGSLVVADVLPGSVTISPCGSAYDFSTQGPIDFAHLYISPRRLDRTLLEVFDREPRSVQLQERLGARAPLIEALVTDMIAHFDEAPCAMPRLYFEGLFEATLLRLVVLATDACDTSGKAPLAIAPYRLRRVHDFIESHISEDISLQMLADTAGLSRFHFCRVFRKATGHSPHGFVNRVRVDRSKEALASTTRPVAEIGRSVGFRSAAQFSSTFKRVAGTPPLAWRRAR